jgi:hypothetical protein
MNRVVFLASILFGAGLPLVSSNAADIPLVNRGDTWRYNKGNSPYQANWKSVTDAGLGASWQSGPGGFGYGDGDDATVLSDMSTSYSTIYIRKSFTIAAPVDTNMHLILVMDWDDGFVAWLDGQELRRDRAPGAVGTEPAVGARATSGHEGSAGGGSAPVTFDLGAVTNRLAPGVHVLALMGLNDQTNSTDLSLIAELKLREPTPPPIVAHADLWLYRKGTTAPVANWQTIADAALDATWLSGPGGFGYADNDDGTTLSDMLNFYSTVYIRKTFNIATPPAENLHVLLTMDWDDGFVAYLDGVEVKRELAPGAVNVEPLFSDEATGLHEASGGGNGASPPVTYDLGLASTLLPPGNHILAIIGLNEALDSSDVSLIADLSLGVPPPGSITTDTTWTAANSPYVVSNNITVASGVTLTIDPGVTVLFNAGAGMVVNGRLLAEGDPTNQIGFTRSGTSGTWNHIVFNANAITSRIAHAEFDYFANSAIEAHNTTLHLDSIVWTNSTFPAVDLHDTSITLLNSYIPGGAGSEPVHFTGMPANGHALIKGCVFGAPRGYNDSIDFTGGNRPGPIAQFLDNVFLAAVDDCFDMDATDAHIEGNIFLNVQQDAQRDSSSNPITTGEGNATSELIICRNIFFNCEHTLLLKDGGSAVMQNNTIVHLTTNALARTGAGTPIPAGIILFGEPWRGDPPGAGAIYEGNIAYDLHALIQANPFPLFDPAQSFFVVSRSLTQGTNWPGQGNISTDPMFVNLAGPMTAANIRSNLALLAGSPCIGTGPNGLDMGALVPAGASISGAPLSATTNSAVTLRVAGPGVVAYKWKLNNGPWSTEIPLTNSILITSNYFNPTNGLVALSGLADGPHTFSAIGKNSSGAWQDTNSAATAVWTVQTSLPLRIETAAWSENVVTLTFIAEAGKTYSVLYRDALNSTDPWLKLKDIPAQSVTALYEAVDEEANLSATRFYRLVTPAQR